MKMDSLTNITTYKQRVCSLLWIMILLTVNIFRVSAQILTRGSGTSDDPYQIATVQDLLDFSAGVNAGSYPPSTYFTLTQDIDMSGVENFTPIGNGSHPFSGYFEGGRHTILNLKVNYPDRDSVGLFGYAEDANVNNLNLMAATITGRNYVGGILGAGFLNVTLSTNTVSGNVAGNDYVGGVVGMVHNQIRIVENTSTVNLTSTGEYAGGIAGRAELYVAFSFNVFAGRLMASQKAGGIIGLISSSTGTSTMAANLSVGSFTALEGSTPSQIGAFAGETQGTGLTIKNNFYDKQMWTGLHGIGGTSSDEEDKVAGKLTTEALYEGIRVDDPNVEYSLSTNHYIFSEGRYPRIKNSPNDAIALAAAAPVKLYAFSSTDFEVINKIKSAFTVCLDGVVWKSADTTVFEVGYYGAAPLRADTSVTLYAVVNNVPVRYIPLHFASESEGFHIYGSKPNPIMINSMAELEKLRDATNNKTNFKGVSGANGFADQYFIQTTDITFLNEWNPVNNVWMAVDAWNTSIGCDNSHPFRGNYDGQDHSITNFVVFSDGSSSSTRTYPLADYRGLFGYMQNASVENLHLAGGVYARSYVGLLAGYAEHTNFTNCSLAATVGKSQNHISASGSRVGGLLGQGKHVTMTNCNSNAIVQAASILGGVAGSLRDTSRLSFSNNTGTVTATAGESAGGIVGVLGDDVGFCIIDNCNNSGAVNGNNYVAGIAARVNLYSNPDDRNSAVRHCTNTAPIKGNSYVGGIIGYGKAVALEYCTVNEAAITATSSYVGGIAGYLTYNSVKDATYPDTAFSTLNHCSSAAQITTEQNYAGGIAGVAEYVKDIHDLSNEGATVTTTTTTSGYFGGFFGSSNRLNLKNLTNKATVTASTDYNGGIIGWGDTWIYIDSCHNEAAVTGKTNTGGLVGRTEGYTSITNSDNEGTVTGLGGEYVGGVMGCLYANPRSGFKGFDAHNLINSGTVTGTSTYVGGVIGRLDGDGRYHNKVTNLKNNAPVFGNSYVGGVFGSAVRYVYMDTLENRGEVTNTVSSYTGGIGGAMGNTTACFDTLKHAINYAPVNGMGYVAGIVAGVSVDDNVNCRGELIDSCENHGSVTANGDYAGGLIAATRGSTIRNSYNDGPLTSTAGYLGGLIGYASWTWRVNATYTDTAYCVLENLVNDADIESNASYTGGAVGYAQYCDIRNLTNNGKVVGMNSTGGLLGSCTLPLQPLSNENCHIGSDVTVQGYSNVGGLVGEFYYGTIRDYESHINVISDNKNGSAGSYIGGVAGNAVGRVFNGDTIPVKFIKVKNYGTVYGTATSGSNHYGGILGYNDKFLLIDSCANYANIEGPSLVGGILGKSNNGFAKILHTDNSGNVVGNNGANVAGIAAYMSYSTGYDTIRYCNNSGTVNSISSFVAGIVGQMNEGASGSAGVNARYCLIDSCTNTGAVTGTENIGGIIGRTYATTISRCHNKADIKGTSTYGPVGGIVGNLLWNPFVNETIKDTCVSKVLNCTNEASVTCVSGNSVGGIVGACSPYSVLGGLKNSGNVVGMDYTGGIIGSCGSYTNLGTIENSGNVSGKSFTGGFIGIGGCVDMIGLTNKVSVTGTGSHVGGIIGYLTGYMKRDSSIINPVFIRDCHNEGTVSSTGDRVGGIAGSVFLCGVAENCSNTAKVKGNSVVGGLFGVFSAADTIRNLINKGNITSTSSVVGGVIGRVNSRFGENVNFSLCNFNQGGSWFYPVRSFYVENIKSNAAIESGNYDYVGGVVGVFEGYENIGGYAKELVHEAGDIRCGNYSGGVVGRAQYNVTLEGITNKSGNITCGCHSGGVVGYLRGNSSLTQAHNTGNVTGTYNLGGVVGYLSETSKLTLASNSGNVTGTYQLGGVVGYLSYSNIFGVLNTGCISGTLNNVGGIAGYVTNGDNAATANDTTGIVRYAFNAGVVSGTERVAGIVGTGYHYYSLPTIDNVVNVGDVFSITQSPYIAAIYGNRTVYYASTSDTKVSAAYFDRQLCTRAFPIAEVGSSRNPEASLLTSDLLGSALRGALDAEHWHFAEGRYPVPKGLENSPAGVIASMPIFLRSNGESIYENVGLVQTNFTVATDPQVSYSNKPADALTVSPEGAATIGDLSRYFNLVDTLTLTCNGETRDIYLRFNGDSALTVDNLQDLRNLRDAVNNGSGTYKGHFSDNGFKDVSFILTTNIDMSEEEKWVPIGRYVDGNVLNDKPFRGIFHGNNDTISNLKAVYGSEGQCIGLFGYMDGAVVDSLHFDNTCSVRGSKWVGALAGFAINNTRIMGCSSAAEVSHISNETGSGGIVGNLKKSIVDGCQFTGNISGAFYRGGIVGSASDFSEVKNSINRGVISGNRFVGGVVGFLSSSSSVINCYNEADFSCNEINIGGIVGRIESYSKIANCTNKGNVEFKHSQGGGIVGMMLGKSTVVACVNLGNILATGNSGQFGGIAGRVEGGSRVDGCVNLAKVNGTVYVGGIVGQLCSADTNYQSTVVHSLNAGEITGSNTTGGVVGFVSADYPAEVSHNFNNALVSAKSYQGAIIGRLEFPEKYTCSHNFSDKQQCLANAAIGSDESLLTQNLKVTLKLTGDALNNEDGLDDGWTFEDNMYPRPTMLNDNASAIVAAIPLFMDSTANTSAGYETVNRIDTLVGLGLAHDVVWTGSSNMNIVGDTAYIIYGECRTDTAKLTVTLEDVSRTFNLNFGDLGNDWSRLTIDNMEDLKAFQHAVNYGGSYKCVTNVDGFAGKHFELTFDPDLASDEETKNLWEPVGWYYNATNLAPFKGYFHGGGHTIYHLNMPSVYINLSKYVGRTDNWNTTSYRGFFGYVLNATIDSLKVQGVVKGSLNNGLLVGWASGSAITHCETVSSAEDSSYVQVVSDNCGGVVGYITGTVLESNINRAGVVGVTYSGGIVGRAFSDCSLDTCNNYGCIISSGQYAGGLVGYADTRVKITDCVNYGNISGKGNNVGGLVGLAKSGAVCSGSMNVGDVSGEENYVGGIYGYFQCDNNDPYDFSNCVNAGTVTGGKQYVGGIIGYLYRNTSYNKIYVRNVVNYAYINGAKSVGGIVGCNENGSLLNCISTGAIHPLSNGGGITASSVTTEVSNCYYDAQMSGAEYAVLSNETLLPEAKRKTLQLLADSIPQIDSTFSEDLWLFSEGRYPRLKRFQDNTAVLVASTPIFLQDTETVRRVHTFPFTVANLDGLTYTSSHPEYVYVEGNEVKQGTLPNDTILVVTLTGNKNGYVHTVPFLIGNLGVLTIDSLADLAAFRDAVNNGTTYKGVSGVGGFSGLYVILTTDIDLSDSCSAESGKSWTPIGNSATSFKGTFLGKGHSISNLYINKTADTDNDQFNYQGLFGSVGEGGSIDSLNVSGEVTGREYVGGIVGYMNNRTVLSNCSFEGNVTGRSNRKYTGGLTGALTYDGLIRNCQSNAVVSGGSYVGGLTGRCQYNSKIEYSNNTGNVSATANYVGGLTGECTHNSKMVYSQNTGDVTSAITSTYGYVGGLAGQTNMYVSVKYCMNAGAVSAKGCVGGLIGYECQYDTIMYCCNIGMVAAIDVAGTGTNSLGGLSGTETSYSNGIFSYNVNAGPVVGTATTTSLGGLEGYSGYFDHGNYNYNINVANVCGYTNSVGGVLGGFYSSFNPNMYFNIFNAQFCQFPTFGSNYSTELRYQGDRYTSEILGTALRDAGVEGYTDENWVFTEGMYPRPKGIDTTTIAKLAATPIYLYENGSLSDYANSVRKNFAITTNADGLAVSYASTKGLLFEGDSAKLNGLTGDQVLHDTLTLSANGIQRHILLDLYPSEISHEYQLTIDSLQDLIDFRDAVNNKTSYKGFSAAGGFSGLTILVTTDIDMSPVCSKTAGSWTPIGTMQYPFKGILNGNNKKISNLYINNVNYAYQGLFGVVNGCHIDSLHLVNVDVTGRDYVGGLAGMMQNKDQISYCSVSGKVVSNYTSDNFIGGVVGRLYFGSGIDHTVNYAYVKGSANYVGGICGYAYQGKEIYACKNAAKVEGMANLGGICGWTYTTNVKSCVNTDTVISYKYTVSSVSDVNMGGIVGRVQYGCEIDNCSSTNTAYVSAAGHYIGGLIGCADFETAVTRCVNHGMVYGHRGSYIGGVVGMLNGGYNNTAMWNYSSISRCENYGLVKGNGEGTGGVVGTLLGTIRSYKESEITYYDTTWVHIDSCNNYAAVTNGVEMNASYKCTGGVAGNVNYLLDTATYCNNSGSLFSKGDLAGGVFGQIAYNSPMAYCSNSGDVSSESSNVGGVVGYSLINSPIVYCSNSGSVSAQKDNVGGVVGQAYKNTPIIYCSNSGTVVSKAGFVGGVAGNVNDNSPIANSSNNGYVKGSGINGRVGGIVGRLASFSNIDSCVNHGSVFAASDHLGGIVGLAEYACSVTNCDNYGMLADSAIGTITAPSIKSYGGGVAGCINVNNGEDPRYRTVCFENNHNHTDQILNYRSNFAGVVGRVQGSRWERNVTEDGKTVTKVDTFLVQIKNCSNSGRIKSLAGDYVGGVVGYANYVDTMAYLVNTGDSVLGGSNYFGGVLGAADRVYHVDSLVNHAAVTSTVIKNVSCVGGISGYFDNNDVLHRLNLSNLYNEGNVKVTSNSVGGIIGYVNGYATMEHLTNKGNVVSLGTDSRNVGGIIGHLANNAGYDTLRYAVNYGEISAQSHSVGGIVGNVNGSIDGGLNNSTYVRCRQTLIDSCVNYGNISGTYRVAGIVGGMNATTVTRAYNLADSVQGTSNYVGGVIGYAAPNEYVNTSATYNISDTAHCYIADVHNEAVVLSTAGTNHGGVIGQLNDYWSVMENATNKANVTGGSQVGGIAGYVLADTLRNCITQGNVTATGNYAGGQVGYASRKTVKGINYPAVFDNVLCQDVPSYRNTPLMLSSARPSNKPQLRDTVQGVQYVGGAIGYAIQHTRKNYVNLNTVIATGNYAGGYAGRIENASLLDSIVNFATVTSTANNVGGIVGEFYGVNNSLDNWSYLHRCLNRGAITGLNYVGGIVGLQNSADIDTCVNYGNVIGSGNYTGGIVGTMWSSNKPSRLAYCLNVGSVENFNINSGLYVGGIAGSMENSANNTMEYVINNAVVRGTNNVSGIVGYRNASDTIRYALNVGHVTTKTSDTDPNEPRAANASGIFGGSAGNDARVYDNYFDWQMSAENEATNAASAKWPEAKKATRQLIADSLRTDASGAGWTDEHFVFTENRYPQLKALTEWNATKTMSKLAASPIYLQNVDAFHDNVELIGNEIEQHYMHMLNDGNYWQHLTVNPYNEFECRVEQHDMPGVIDSTEILCQFSQIQILVMRDTLEDEELFVNLWLGRNPEVTRVKYDTICYSALPIDYGDMTFDRSDFDTIKTYSGEVMKYHFYNCDSVVVYFVECIGLHTYTDSITLCANKEYKTSWWEEGGATIIPGGDMPAGNGGSGHTYHYDYTLRKDTVFRGKDFDSTQYNKWIHYENILVPSSSGCDSITDFYLYVHPYYDIHESIEVCKEAFPFKYAGATFQEPYTGQVTDAAIHTQICDCDSVTGLYVTTINYTDRQPYSYDTVCVGTYYVNDGWVINTDDSASLQEPGTYEFHRIDLTQKEYKIAREDIPGCYQCDSAVNLRLTLTKPTLIPNDPSLADDTTIYYNNVQCEYTEVALLTTSDFTVKDPQNGAFTVEHSDTTNNAQGCEWTYLRTYVWTDECGNRSTVEQVITVKDSTRPALASTTWADSTVYMTAYSEDCDLFTLPTPYTTVKEVNDAYGSAFITDCNIGDGQVVNHFDEDKDTHSCDRYILRTYTVSDSCGNGPAVFTHKIWVKDTVKPILEGTLTAATVYLASDCGITLPDPYTTTEELLANGLTAVKDCNSSLTVTKTDVQDNNNTCDRFYIRTYKIADACGNYSTTDQLIHVLDTVKPKFNTIDDQNATVAGNCQYEIPDLQAVTMAAVISDCNGQSFVGQDIAVGTKYDQTDEEQSIPVVVTVKDSCGNENTTTINVKIPAKVSISNMEVAGISCQGNDGAIDITPANGTTPYSYLWSTGATTEDISGLSEPGKYIVTVTDANGCVAKDSAELTALPLLQVINGAIPNRPVSCKGDSDGELYVSATGGEKPYTYLWSTSATDTVVKNLPAGNYTVTVTDNRACTASQTLTVEEPEAALQLSNVSKTDAVCYGAADGTVTATVSGGWTTAPYTITIGEQTTSSTGAVSIEGLSAGTYTLQAEDLYGCTVKQENIVIDQPTQLVNNFTCSSKCYEGDDGVIIGSVSGGVAPYTLQLVDVESKNMSAPGDFEFKNLADGTYIMILTDDHSCKKTDTAKIQRNEKPLTVKANSHTWTYDGLVHYDTNFVVIYDGDTSASVLSGHTYTLANNDVVSAVVTGSITTVASSPVVNVLSNIVVTRGTDTVTCEYNIISKNGTLTVTARDLMVKLDTSKVYDGAVMVSEYAASNHSFTVTGLQNGATISGTVTSSSATVGTYTDSSATAEAVITTEFATSDGIGNYNVTYDFKQEITKASCITLTCPSGEAITKVYDAAVMQPSATATTTIVGDVIKVEYKTASTDWGETAISLTDAGTLAVDVRATNPNYDTATCSYTLTITQRPITLTARDTNFYFDGLGHSAAQMSTPRYVINNSTQLISGHNLVTDVTSKTISVLDDTAHTVVGTVTITDASSNDVTANYAITKVDGLIKIEGFPQKLTISSEFHRFDCYNKGQKYEHYSVKYGETTCAAVEGSDYKFVLVPVTGIHDTLTITPTCEGTTAAGSSDNVKNTFTYVLQNDIKYVGTRDTVYGYLTQPDTLTLTLTSDNPVCEDGSVMSFTTGGNGGNTFKLNDDDNDNVGVYNHLSAGNYTVKVTDSKGCSATQSVTLTAVPVTETVGITRAGEITSYAPDTTVDASGDLTDFPALTASGEIIAQPVLSGCTAVVDGHKVTLTVNVESIGVLPILVFELSKDAGFSTTVPMYTHKVAPVTEDEQTFNFMNLPTGTYYVRAKLYNCAGGSITAAPATATVTVE